MSTSRPFAYNPSPNPLISGTTQVGDIAIGVNPNLDYFGGAGGVQWWQGPDEDLGYIVAKPIPPLTQPNPLNIPAGVAFGRSLFTEESFILLAESLSSGTTFTSGNDASTWLTSNGYWNTWVFITPTPTPTLTQTPTPTPTLTQTPTPTLDLFLGSLVSCSNQGGSPTNEMYLPTLYYPYTIGPLSGWYATTVIDTIGDCYYVVGVSSPGLLPQLTWGGTNTSSWLNYYNQGQYSGCTQCISTPTPTQTPTNTQTPTTSTTPTGTPASTPPPTPAPQYYYMSPNSFAPPTIGPSPINNYLITDQPLSTIINTGDLDYTTTNWSFSVWGYPQFDSKQFTPNDDYITVLLSLAVPVDSPQSSPSNTSTNLTVGVQYNSGATLLNDLIVWMIDDANDYAKWTWAINGDTNQIITGINSTKMWDNTDYGSTANAQKFSNIVISHDESLVIPNVSGSTKAYWNGQLLTLKSYTTNSSYPHIGSYTSLDNTSFYIASGSRMGTSVNQFLSINTDNPTYYPLTVLTQPNAATLYNGGVVPPSIPNTINAGYIWNFDNASLQHLQCLDSTNTPVSDFDLVVFDSTAPNEVTFTLI